ncbi:olfactory receptor 52D1-like [Polyodon spathula]|uniref:olfactory receptor 52D1-like n=2 Tax=Polyodon spathula TaxID=7913 RepID=UPI001B7F07B0|nr:olfactory receptor 52D1-like [Polyodon spathula]
MVLVDGTQKEMEKERFLLVHQHQLTMENSSHITTFLFTIYEEIGYLRYLYFTAALLGYLVILFVNIVLITVIIRERSLHEPMYIFVCNLALNGLYGSSAFYPRLMHSLLADTPTISRFGCLLQIFCIHTYGMFEFSILSVMAYDRYVSICNPLRYSSIMSPRKVAGLTAFVYLYPICIFIIHISLTIRLPLCGSVIEKLYCDNWSVVKLSCVDISVNSVFGLCVTVLVMIPQLIVVAYSYIKIITVCLKASKEARGKAVQTCVPHLVTLTNYYIATFFEVLHQRFDTKNLPLVLRIIMSVDFLLLPPLLNPIIYGVKIQAIRKRVIQMFKSSKANSISGAQKKMVSVLQ